VFMLTVGPRLQLERIRKKISQTELARRTGIAQANLSNIENGKQDITVSTFLQICLALDIKPASVFDTPAGDRQKNPRFTRARLENIAASVVGNRPASSKDDEEIVLLLRQNILPMHGRKTSAKRAAVHWADLRQRLTAEEIATLRQRVEDAFQRRTNEKKHP
jgi:transcriptional regulator with XRE-family HTH domain